MQQILGVGPTVGVGELEQLTFCNEFPKRCAEEIKMQQIWVLRDDGIWECSICKSKRSKGLVFDPAQDTFKTKTQHNTQRTHTDRLLKLLHAEDGMHKVEWPDGLASKDWRGFTGEQLQRFLGDSCSRLWLFCNCVCVRWQSWIRNRPGCFGSNGALFGQ